MILAKNKETSSVVGGAKEGSHGNSVDGSVSDEEIPSDSEEETEKDVGDVISDQSEEEENEQSAITRKRLKRKRKRPDWVSGGKSAPLSKSSLAVDAHVVSKAIHNLSSHSISCLVELPKVLSLSYTGQYPISPHHFKKID